jgi:hypothetical protein
MARWVYKYDHLYDYWLIFKKGTNLSLFPEIKKSFLKAQISVMSNKVGKDME